MPPLTEQLTRFTRVSEGSAVTQMKTTLLPLFTLQSLFTSSWPPTVRLLYVLKEGFKPFWTQRESNLQKTVKPLRENLFKALAPATCATQTLRESETWSESPQRYCALWAAASSLWAGVTAEWRKSEANCCLNREGSSTAFMFTVRHGGAPSSK